jgi:hypothetical protein
VFQIFCGFVVFFFALLHLYNLATNRWIFIKSLSAFCHLALTVMHHARMLSSSHALICVCCALVTAAPFVIVVIRFGGAQHWAWMSTQ